MPAVALSLTVTKPSNLVDELWYVDRRSVSISTSCIPPRDGPVGQPAPARKPHAGPFGTGALGVSDAGVEIGSRSTHGENRVRLVSDAVGLGQPGRPLAEMLADDLAYEVVGDVRYRLDGRPAVESPAVTGGLPIQQSVPVGGYEMQWLAGADPTDVVTVFVAGDDGAHRIAGDESEFKAVRQAGYSSIT